MNAKKQYIVDALNARTDGASLCADFQGDHTNPHIVTTLYYPDQNIQEEFPLPDDISCTLKEITLDVLGYYEPNWSGFGTLFLDPISKNIEFSYYEKGTDHVRCYATSFDEWVKN